MRKVNILLSTGSIPWLSLSQVTKLAKELEFDGLEFVPFRKTFKEIDQKLRQTTSNHIDFTFLKSIHQSWRLDIGHDKEYAIGFAHSLFFNAIRFFLFSDSSLSQKYIGNLSNDNKIPVVVHDITTSWTYNQYDLEFAHGIELEILGVKRSKEEVRAWLKRDSKHSIVVDTRDDQSVIWAKQNGFLNWKEFWMWIGLKKIKGIQLTLIGTSGIRKILNHELTLAEEQFLWLCSKKWVGTVTLEISPISLMILSRGNLKKGLRTLLSFARQTVVDGKSWS